MVGRPERSDPDELTYNLFLSANIANGYNFVGYNNPAYDRLAQAHTAALALCTPHRGAARRTAEAVVALR